MTTILPQARGPWDLISQSIGQSLERALPQAVQRRQGLEALNQAETQIAQAGNDPLKIAMAFARAGAVNPALERSLGPLLEIATRRGRVNAGYGGQGQNGQINPQGNPLGITSNMMPTQSNVEEYPNQQTPTNFQQTTPSNIATANPFNIMDPQSMQNEAQRFALTQDDPAAYQRRFNELTAQNENAIAQRQLLENELKRAGVPSDDITRAMMVGSKHDFRNIPEWVEKTKRSYNEAKGVYDKLKNAFIPQIGAAMRGENREEALKRVQPDVKDLVNRGLEQDVRQYLTSQHVSPTEVESLIHPMTPQEKKSLSKIPNGIFKPKIEEEQLEKLKGSDLSRASLIESPFVSYEEAVKKAPKQMEFQQNMLSDFFLNTVKEDTALLPLRHALWEKGYDWRQIGPAIAEARQRGLSLSPSQEREMSEINSQPPRESLPHIFWDFNRPFQFIRGNK